MPIARTKSDERIASEITFNVGNNLANRIANAIADERERCAKIAEAYKADEPETVRAINYRNGIAAAIRSQ